jgi:hypothetical protein
MLAGCVASGAAEYDEAEAYEALVEAAEPLRIADAISGRAWLIALDGQRFPCMITRHDRA